MFKNISLIIITIFQISILDSAKAEFQEPWKNRHPQIPVKTLTEQIKNDFKLRIQKERDRCLSELEDQFSYKWPRRKNGNPKRLKIHLEEDPNMFSGNAITSGNFFIKIDLKLYPFSSGNHDFEKTLCHEIVHAYFRKFMRMSTYAQLPRWAREGSAVHLAKQTHIKEASSFFMKFHQQENLVNGLEGDHSFEDYLEDALAFKYLEELRADKNVLKRVLSNQNIFSAITAETNLSKNDFINGAKEFSKKYIQDKNAVLPTPVVDGFTLIRSTPSQRRQGALLILEGLTNQGISLEQILLMSPLQLKEADLSIIGLAFGALKESYFLSSQPQTALKVYEMMVNSIPPHFYGNQLANIRYSLAYLYKELGEFEKAIFQFSKVFNEHSEVPMLQTAVPTALARTYFAMSDWNNTLKWTKEQRGLHSTDLMEFIYMRAKSFYQLDKRNDAKKEIAKLDGKEIPRAFKEKVEELKNLLH